MAQAAELDSPTPSLTLPPALRGRVGRVQAILKAGRVSTIASLAGSDDSFRSADGASLLEAVGFLLNNTAAYSTDMRVATLLRALGDRARDCARVTEQAAQLTVINLLASELVNLVEGA